MGRDCSLAGTCYIEFDLLRVWVATYLQGSYCSCATPKPNIFTELFHAA